MNFVKYHHIRNWDYNNETVSNLGGLTVAYRIDNDSGVISYALAKCAENENFCRKTGREIALGRLKNYRKRRETSSTEYDLLTSLEVEWEMGYVSNQRLVPIYKGEE